MALNSLHCVDVPLSNYSLTFVTCHSEKMTPVSVPCVPVFFLFFCFIFRTL